MSSAKKSCRVCGAPASSACGGCRSASYCSRDHQLADWNATHKFTCAKLPPALKGVSIQWRPQAATSALVAGAENVSASGEPPYLEEFYRHPESARNDFGEYLKELATKAPIVADDALFVQLVLAAHGLLAEVKGPLMFGAGDWAPWLVTKRARAAPGEEALRPGYLTPADPAAAKTVQKTPSGGGQWLLGPDGNNMFLGLAPEGPARLPLRAWHRSVLDQIRAEASEAPPEIRQAVGLLLIDDLEYEKYELRREPHD